MSRYRFALRPWWILSHLFVLALVGAMLVAGFWQLSRLQEKKDRNDKVAARASQPVVDVGSLVDPGEFDAVEDLEYRAVSASGEYLADQEVIVRSRSNDGAPGSWVLTPLELSDGTAVVVNRGWFSNSGLYEAVPDAFAAPAGPVSVTGLVRQTETRGSFGATDPDGETVTNLARADIDRLDAQVPEELLPLYIQLEQQDPAVTQADPSPLPVPVPDEGPHLSYAVQWFIFTTVALIGYPMILIRRARDRHADPEPSTPALD